MKEWSALARNRDRQQRSATDSQDKMLKVLDFSADNDQKPDINGEYTSTAMEAGSLPESFTICLAFRIESWADSAAAQMFSLLDNDGYKWEHLAIYATSTHTEYEVWFGPVHIINQTETVFFPLQWSSACLFLDSIAGKVMLVVDGQLLGEEEYKKEDNKYRPANLSLVLGFNGYGEDTGRSSELNIFASSLSKERMIGLTTAGGEECGAPGNLFKWGETEWISRIFRSDKINQF